MEGTSHFDRHPHHSHSVISATFKIIKGLLPPKAVERLRFVSKKNIDEYIARDKMLTSWGGTDDYKFEFTFQDPTVTILARDPEDDNNNDNNSVQANRNGIGSRKVGRVRKERHCNMGPVINKRIMEKRKKWRPRKYFLAAVFYCVPFLFTTQHSSSAISFPSKTR